MSYQSSTSTTGEMIIADEETLQLRERFLDEFRKSAEAMAEGLDVGIGFQADQFCEWIASSSSCGCSNPLDVIEEGRIQENIKVSFDGHELGNVAVCHQPANKSALKAVDYLIRMTCGHLAFENTEQSLLEELSSSWESLEAVYEISSDLQAVDTPSDLLDRIITRAASVREGLMAVLWLDNQGSLEPVATKNVAGLRTSRREGGLLARAIKGSDSVVINGRSKVIEITDCDVEFENASNIAIAPIATRQGVTGALAVWEREDRGHFNSHCVRLFQALALQAAMVVENDRLHKKMVANERLHQQIEIGSKIQQALLLGRTPKIVNRVEVGALSSASQSIDGDFYDFIEHNDSCLDVVVGDVMGKGIPAALMGAATKSEVLRAMSRSRSPLTRGWIAEPEEIVGSVHAELTKQFIDLESFTTLCYARFDLDTNQVCLVDCGHTRTIRYWRRVGACGLLEGQNMPLGFSEGEVYKQFSLPVEPGDIFVFYSDGVTEARNEDDEMFGESRVADCVARFNYLDAQHLVDRIKQEVISFTGTDHLEDDFTCLAVKIAEEGEDQAPGIRTVVTSDLRDLGRIRDFVRRAFTELPPTAIDQETQSALELGVNEAASNIMRHAYSGQNDKPVYLNGEIERGRLVIRLCHEGEAFDPSVARPPSFDGSRDGGFGLFIIEQTFDEVTYGVDDRGRSCTRLVKNL